MKLALDRRYKTVPEMWVLLPKTTPHYSILEGFRGLGMAIFTFDIVRYTDHSCKSS